MLGASSSIAATVRAGGHALLLLSDSVNVSILRLLAAGPLEGAELATRLEHVSRSTRFKRLHDLERLNLVVREKHGGRPPATDCRLTAAGHRLLPVVALLEAWLACAPDGFLALGDAMATGAIAALAVGWGSTVLRWLAERPHSLTELDPLVEEVGYRELERVVRNLVKVDLVERVGAEQRRHPYSVTRWARESVAPLAAAVHWERRAIPEFGAPVTAIDAEGGLFLAVTLIELPDDLDGDCVLMIDTEAPAAEPFAGVAVRVVAGRLVYVAPVEPSQSAQSSWARGTVSSWLAAVIDERPGALRTSGDVAVIEALIGGLHRAFA